MVLFLSLDCGGGRGPDVDAPRVDAPVSPTAVVPVGATEGAASPVARGAAEVVEAEEAAGPEACPVAVGEVTVWPPRLPNGFVAVGALEAGAAGGAEAVAGGAGAVEAGAVGAGATEAEGCEVLAIGKLNVGAVVVGASLGTCVFVNKPVLGAWLVAEAAGFCSPSFGKSVVEFSAPLCDG